MTEPSLSAISGPPLSEEGGIGALTLPGYLREIAGRHADREALCWYDLEGERRSWTYAEFYRDAQRVARALLAAGVGRNARVGLLMSNRPEWLIAMYGASMAGAVTVACNTFSTLSELEHQLRLADIEMLLMEAGVASRSFIEDIPALCPALAASAPGALYDDRFPFLRRVVCVDPVQGQAGIQAWDDFLAGGDDIPLSLVEATSAAVCPVDCGLVFFSSGSTALPKAVQQTHRAATLQNWRFRKWFDLDETARTWCANGFFFSGNFTQVSGTTSAGGCLVLTRYFQPDEALALIQREKVSCIVAWPHQETRLTECAGWDGADLSAIKRVNFNSPFRSHPSTDIPWPGMNAWGMTETFTFFTCVAGDDYTEDSHGVILPGNTMHIVDPESGEVLPLGEIGEIIVKGATMTPGYLKVAPEDIFDAEGFLHTNDAGALDADGHLHWKGRLGDIIKTGGANVSPTEVDDVLFRHPAVQGVTTVGVPDASLGELVVACVVLQEGEKIDQDALREYAKRYLSSYKVPRRVLFFSHEELPTTGSNKVRRQDLREVAARRLADG